MSAILNLDELISYEEYVAATKVEPPQRPPTILDLERAEGCFDMHLPLADPCPSCGAFRMQVGDWVCFGLCSVCYDALHEDVKALL